MSGRVADRGVVSGMAAKATSRAAGRPRFVVKRRMRKLKALRREMRTRRHEPLRDQQRWLSAVRRGH